MDSNFNLILNTIFSEQSGISLEITHVLPPINKVIVDVLIVHIYPKRFSFNRPIGQYLLKI